jgi:hypothetical protein
MAIILSFLSSGEETDSHLTNIKIDEFGGLVGDKTSEVTTNKAMPPVEQDQ